MRLRLLTRLAFGTIAATFLATSCLVPIGTQKQASWFDAPDPAFMPVYFGGAQVFTTRANYYGWRNVPSFTLTIPGGGVSGIRDALPVTPNWAANGSDTWAPSIRKIGSNYLLMFSNSKNSGNHEMCIGQATASSLVSNFSPRSFKLCGPPGHQYIDPQIFVSPGGTNYLLWSDQWSANGGSRILARKLTANGLDVTGSTYTVLTYAQAVTASSGTPRGTNSYLENPAIVKDPYNQYDLLVSLGTWNQSNTYRTVEVPCLVPYGSCVADRGGALNLVGNNPGGASLMADNSPAYNYMVWHAGSPGARLTYFTETTAVNLNNGISASLRADNGREAGIPAELKEIAPQPEVLTDATSGDPSFNRNDRATAVHLKPERGSD